MMKYENLKLDNQLCFALYSATHALTRAYRNALESTGLTYTQYLVLLALWENNNLTVKSVADRLDLDSASLTPILKRLEVAGFLTRQRNKADERVVEIALTEQGHALQDEVANIQKRVACQTGLPPNEFELLKGSLHKLVETMRTNEIIDIKPAA
jgi:MarR family transcriptional regulator, organic hydroperoxide resistance regulator